MGSNEDPNMTIGDVIESEFNRAKANIVDAAENLKQACSKLRTLYVVLNTDGLDHELADIHHETTNCAVVYSKKISPIANYFVLEISSHMESYVIIEDVEEFKDNIEVLAEEAEENEKLSRFVGQLHNKILALFKEQEDRLAIFMKKEELNNRESILAVSKNTQTYIDDLAVPIKGFVTALTAISGFFSIIQGKLEQLGKDVEKRTKTTEKRISMSFRKFKMKSQEIYNSCSIYTESIPGWISDLNSVPYSKEYVENWLSMVKGKDRGGEKNFLEWGKELFPENKWFLLIEA